MKPHPIAGDLQPGGAVASAPEDQGIEAGGFQPDSQPIAAIGNGGAVILWGQGAKVEPGGAGGTGAGQGACGDHQDRFPGKGGCGCAIPEDFKIEK